MFFNQVSVVFESIFHSLSYGSHIQNTQFLRRLLSLCPFSVSSDTLFKWAKSTLKFLLSVLTEIVKLTKTIDGLDF